MTDSRVCVTCGQEMPLTNFVKSPDRPSGYRNICKPCYKATRKAREALLSTEERERREHQHRAKDAARILQDVDKVRQESRDAQRKYRDKLRAIRADGSPPPIVVSEKACTQCGRVLPIAQFHRLITSPDGHKPRCVGCAGADRRRDYQENKERRIAARNLRRPKYKAKERAYNRQWAANNPGRRSELLRQWQEANRGKTREYANKRERRRRIVAEILGQHTEQEWQDKLTEYDGKCAHCGTAENITRDHIIPLSKGGSDLIDNIQPLCGRCNSRKGNRLP